MVGLHSARRGAAPSACGSWGDRRCKLSLRLLNTSLKKRVPFVVLEKRSKKGCCPRSVYTEEKVSRVHLHMIQLATEHSLLVVSVPSFSSDLEVLLLHVTCNTIDLSDSKRPKHTLK